MSGQPFQQQSTGFNKNANNNNQFDSSFVDPAVSQQNSRQPQSNTNRTTPDSGLGTDDQNKQDKNRQAPPGFGSRTGPYNQNRQGLQQQGPIYYQQQTMPYSGNQDNSNPQFDGPKGFDNSYVNYDASGPSRGYNQYNQQPPMESSGQSYDEANGNGQFIIQSANEPFERPPMQYHGAMMNSGYEMPPGEQGGSQYRSYPSQGFNNQGGPPNFVMPQQQPPMAIQGQPYPNAPANYRQVPPGTSQQQVMMVPMQMPNQSHPAQQYYQGAPIPNQAPQMFVNPAAQPFYFNVPVGIVTRSMSGSSGDKEKSNGHNGKNKRGSQHSLEKNSDTANSEHMPISHFDPNQPANQDYNPNMYNQNPQYPTPPPTQHRIIPQVPMGFNQYGQPLHEAMNHMQMQQMQYGNGMPAMNMPPPPPPQGYPQNFHPAAGPGGPVANYRQPRQMGPEPLMANTYQNPMSASPRNGGSFPIYSNQQAPFPMGNTFHGGMQRGAGRGRGRGGWRGGHDRDGSFNHSRQNSGNYDNRYNTSYRGGNYDSSHNDQAQDDDVSMLTNRIQRLEPAPRMGSPSKQVLKLHEPKSPEKTVTETAENVGFVENQPENVNEVVESEEVVDVSVEVVKKSEEEGTEEEREVLHCYKCEAMKMPFDVIKSHRLKKPNGDTWCPQLQKEICDICGATGLRAHSTLACPKKKEQALSENNDTDDSQQQQQHREDSVPNFQNERRNADRGNYRGGFRGNSGRGSAGGGFGKPRGAHHRGGSRGGKYENKK